MTRRSPIGQPLAKTYLDKVHEEQGIPTAGLESDPTNFECIGCTTRTAGQQAERRAKLEEWKIQREKQHGKADRALYVAGKDKGAGVDSPSTTPAANTPK